jgi:3-deoxy-D-manno-octulosonic-acid transferase
LIPLFSVPLLRRRLRRGKEDPGRWREKLGVASLRRPDGPLVWCHAVGLGEVLALRGLINAMARQRPELRFLVTSTARSSAQVFAFNLPPGTVHQFLPLDAPAYLSRFLDHWRPALSVWAEQELWPGAVAAVHARGIPLALVNARITARSHARRRRLRPLYRELLSCFALISVQESASAARLLELGAPTVRVHGSFKPVAPPLTVDWQELGRLRRHLAGRRVWLAASTHPGDEQQVFAAQVLLREMGWLLILVPRDPRRADIVASALSAAGLQYQRRSLAQLPTPQHSVWLADSYGELGLWYRLAEVALVGGGFDHIGGHNPWEPASLGVPVLHGPDAANFLSDYMRLDGADAARCVAPGALAEALQQCDLPQVAARASVLVRQARGQLAPLARDLLLLMQA